LAIRDPDGWFARTSARRGARGPRRLELSAVTFGLYSERPERERQGLAFHDVVETELRADIRQ